MTAAPDACPRRVNPRRRGRPEPTTAGCGRRAPRHRATVVLGLLLLAQGYAAAQAPDSTLVSAVRAVEIGRQVRLDVAQRGRVQGRLLVVTDSSLTLAWQEAPLPVRLPDVQRLWVRGRATGTGALIGAGVGAVAGAVFGLLIGQVACEPVDGGDCTAAEVAAVTGLLGGAGGAALGAAIGFALPRWSLRFP